MPKSSLLVYILCLLTLSSASYNNYRRGKRSDEDVRKCLSCGPEMKGNCFGPSICCGTEFGCLTDAMETQRCLEENDMPEPCMSGWKWCGDQGRCAVEKTCCNTEHCTPDDSCALL